MNTRYTYLAGVFVIFLIFGAVLFSGCTSNNKASDVQEKQNINKEQQNNQNTQEENSDVNIPDDSDVEEIASETQDLDIDMKLLE